MDMIPALDVHVSTIYLYLVAGIFNTVVVSGTDFR